MLQWCEGWGVARKSVGNGWAAHALPTSCCLRVGGNSGTQPCVHAKAVEPREDLEGGPKGRQTCSPSALWLGRGSEMVLTPKIGCVTRTGSSRSDLSNPAARSSCTALTPGRLVVQLGLGANERASAAMVVGAVPAAAAATAAAKLDCRAGN